MTETTIFQKIINEEIPCDKLYEDKFCIAFNDIQAQAPVHFLAVSYTHLTLPTIITV